MLYSILLNRTYPELHVNFGKTSRNKYITRMQLLKTDNSPSFEQRNIIKFEQFTNRLEMRDTKKYYTKRIAVYLQAHQFSKINKRHMNSYSKEKTMRVLVPT